MEPYRPSLDLEAMVPEAREVVERTEQMLADLDSHAGRFAGLSYDAAPAILDHPFMSDVGLSRAEIWNTLERERLSRICGYRVSPQHDNRYAHIQQKAHAWIDRTGYDRDPISLKHGKFPLIRRQISDLRSSLSDAGMTNVRSTGSGGVSEIHFEFAAIFFGKMHGRVDIRTKYDGDTRFSIFSGAILADDAVLRISHEEALGALHYIRFGLQPPSSTKFVMPRDDATGKLGQAVALMVGIASYYQAR